MEQETNNNTQQQNIQSKFITKPDLPSATAILVLGIISIASFWCYGIVGIITGIIALAISGTPKRLYNENPGKYSESSFKNLNAGRITAIIGLALSCIWVVVILIYVLVIGAAVAGMGGF